MIYCVTILILGQYYLYIGKNKIDYTLPLICFILCVSMCALLLVLDLL